MGQCFMSMSKISPTVQLCSFHPVLKLFIEMSKLDNFLIRQVLRVLSSYSVAGKITVITGPFQGIDIVVAHACVWAKMSHIILVGPQESTLMAAKAQLKVSVDGCGASTRVHAHAAEITDIDRIASIFFNVRRRIGIPDLLILCTPSRFSSGLVHEYAIEDIVRHLDLNEKSKKAFTDNFLTPGTRKRKTLIDLSMIADEHLPRSLKSEQKSKPHRHFLTYAMKKDREWFLVFHDIRHGLVTTKRLGENLHKGSQAWVLADSRYVSTFAEPRLMSLNSRLFLSARAVVPARKDRLNIQ